MEPPPEEHQETFQKGSASWALTQVFQLCSTSSAHGQKPPQFWRHSQDPPVESCRGSCRGGGDPAEPPEPPAQALRCCWMPARLRAARRPRAAPCMGGEAMRRYAMMRCDVWCSGCRGLCRFKHGAFLLDRNTVVAVSAAWAAGAFQRLKPSRPRAVPVPSLRHPRTVPAPPPHRAQPCATDLALGALALLPQLWFRLGSCGQRAGDGAAGCWCDEPRQAAAAGTALGSIFHSQRSVSGSRGPHAPPGAFLRETTSGDVNELCNYHEINRREQILRR